MAIDLTIRIGGEGGEGVISSGDFLMQAATRAGMEVVTFKSFPSEIKGGYALSQLRISDEKILSQGDGFNILVAFNGEAYSINKPLLTPGTVLVWDGPRGDFEPEPIPGVTMYNVPMTHISKQELKNPIAKNMVAMGSVAGLFGVPMESLKASVAAKFKRKGQEVIDFNYAALQAGYDYVKQNHKKTDPFTFPPTRPAKDVITLEGNEAIALGAIVAGCRFYPVYPITPATSVGNYLSELILKVNGFVYQAEDEIAAIAAAIGASYVGIKSFTATSGPGVSLMTELLGLAAMAEIPLVIVDVQRGGPSTGMPTKHEQSDLFITAHGGHGDVPKIVLAAADVEECFYLTIEAFNLAEKYQTPVFLLSDASLSLRVEAIKRPDLKSIRIVSRDAARSAVDPKEFMRYKNTASGISTMGIPGVPGSAYAATGLEHAEDSGPRTSVETKTNMTEKRWRKLDNLENETSPIEREGDADADVGIVSWGLTQTMVREAVVRLRKKGHKVAALYPKILWPVPARQIEAFAASVKTVLVPEANVQGQFAELIRSKTSVVPVKQTLYRGEPFLPKEIEAKVEELINANAAVPA